MEDKDPHYSECDNQIEGAQCICDKILDEQNSIQIEFQEATATGN